MHRIGELLLWLLTTLLVLALIPLLPFVWILEKLRFGRWWVRLGLILGIAAAAGVIYAYCAINTTIGVAGSTYSVVIRPGDDAADLRQRLAEAGLSTDRRLYNLSMRYSGAERQLKPGRFHIPGGLTHYELATFFRDTNPDLSRVTIAEGLTIREIVPLLVQSIPTDSVELVRHLNDPSFRKDLGIDAPSIEGYLFPETYSFYPHQSPREVIAEMVRMMRAQFTPDCEARRRDLKWSVNQALTLASLIEAEAADSSERTLISSVFHNRLQRGMKLQCDPTVVYALGGLDRPLQRSDWTYDSPYNTYVYFGLPPGPICAPGAASIRAALFPATSDYLYFVATGDGRHTFSETLTQHNRANAAAKRLLRKMQH